ncbi:MAG: TIR domain-containing protein, partial [Fusobacteriaceae bacterium]
DKENRFPSEVVDTSQSYDIINEINQRKLNGDYFNLIGKCFARIVIVSYFTASFKKETKIFLSHRRKEGEDIVNSIKEVANNRHEKIYIDLHEITVGENAQEEINKKLKNDTDILIFLQTPTSFESEYQLIELKRALELDIPILWVTLGFEERKLLQHYLFIQ